MADSRLATSQWEMSLQSNAVSHWLGANLESVLGVICKVATIFIEGPAEQDAYSTDPLKECAALLTSTSTQN